MIVQPQHMSSCFFDDYIDLSIHFLNIVQTAFESLTFSFAFIYLIHLQGDKFREAEELFDNLLNDENSALKPDPKMFNMMIYIHKKAGSYEKARKTFALMAELGIQQTTVTYNSLMSFETNYI